MNNKLSDIKRLFRKKDSREIFSRIYYDSASIQDVTPSWKEYIPLGASELLINDGFKGGSLTTSVLNLPLDPSKEFLKNYLDKIENQLLPSDIGLDKEGLDRIISGVPRAENPRGLNVLGTNRLYKLNFLLFYLDAFFFVPSHQEVNPRGQDKFRLKGNAYISKRGLAEYDFNKN